MTALHIAKISLENWRASGARTLERLDALVDLYAASYYGPMASWADAIRDEINRAHGLARSSVKSWEMAGR